MKFGSELNNVNDNQEYVMSNLNVEANQLGLDDQSAASRGS